MVTKLLSHPFRINPNGQAACLEENRDDYLAERIGLVLTTITGERPMCPQFGAGDLAFDGLALHQLNNQISLWRIPVRVTELQLAWGNDHTGNYSVCFDNLWGQ